MPEISIIIPTHQRADLLRRTLSSVAELELPRPHASEVVVVMNACSDHTAEVVQEAARTLPLPVVPVVEPTPGLNLARNTGVMAARGDVIAFLDDDVWLDRTWLEALLGGAATGHAFFAGRITLEWESAPPSFRGPAVDRLLSINDLGHEQREITRPGQVVGANFALRQSLFREIGLFQPELDRRGTDLLSGGETELIQRALDAGHIGIYLPSMAVRHWIPAARSRLAYLDRLAFGRGRTRALLDAAGNGRALILARLGLAQTLRGTARELGGRLRGDEVERVSGRLLKQRGLGALSGLASRRRSSS